MVKLDSSIVSNFFICNNGLFHIFVPEHPTVTLQISLQTLVDTPVSFMRLKPLRIQLFLFMTFWKSLFLKVVLYMNYYYCLTFITFVEGFSVLSIPLCHKTFSLII